MYNRKVKNVQPINEVSEIKCIENGSKPKRGTNGRFVSSKPFIEFLEQVAWVPERKKKRFKASRLCDARALLTCPVI